MEYLTEEDFKKAEKNGINRQRAYARFYIDGWSKRRSITQPLQKKRLDLTEHRKIAQANGIRYSTFYSRVKDGWTPEEACTKPIGYKRPRQKKISDEHLVIAAKNGIKATTVWNRVKNLFWPIEKAITKPVNQKFNWRKQA